MSYYNSIIKVNKLQVGGSIGIRAKRSYDSFADRVAAEGYTAEELAYQKVAKEKNAAQARNTPHARAEAMMDKVLTENRLAQEKRAISNTTKEKVMPDKTAASTTPEAVQQQQPKARVSTKVASSSSGSSSGGSSKKAATKTVKKLSLTDRIKNIQRGLGVEVDGMWGEETQGAYLAMKARQEALGVKSDGIRGKETTKALYDRDMLAVNSLEAIKAPSTYDRSSLPITIAVPHRTAREMRREARIARRNPISIQPVATGEYASMRTGGLLYKK